MSAIAFINRVVQDFYDLVLFVIWLVVFTVLGMWAAFCLMNLTPLTWHQSLFITATLSGIILFVRNR